MRITAIAIAAVLACAASCSGKKDPGRNVGGGSGAPPIAACAPGSLPDKTGACVVVITPPKVMAVAQQQILIDELATKLDKLDALSAPIELLDSIRQTDAWKKISATSDKWKIVDSIVQTLGDSVKQLHAFRADLTDLQKRLADLHGELDKLIAGTGMATSLDDARAQVSAQVKALVAPYAQQTADTIQHAIAPLVVQLADVADLVRGACAMAKMSGGSDQLKDLCAKASDAFTQAQAFLDAIRLRPAQLFAEVENQLLSQLDTLLDDGTKAALAAAQKQVDDALHAQREPVTPAAVGSGSGSGSGT